MATNSGYCSPDQIIGDAALLAGDPELKEFSYGNYLGEIQSCLTELAFDTYFDERIYDGPITGLVMPLPEGLFSIDRIWAYSGNACVQGYRQTIWSKREFVRNGVNRFAEQDGQQDDPFMEDTLSATTAGSILYYNIVDHHFHFSDAVGAWPKLFIKYRGMGCKLGDQPIVPNELRRAVTTYVALQQATKLFSKYRTQDRLLVLNNMKKDHFGGQGTFDVGTWKQAQRRVQSISSKQRDDMAKYLNTLGNRVL